MHEQEFCSSFQPPTAKVFGVALDTFAIGHELALVRQGNPLATYGAASFAELSEPAKKLALSLALEICGNLKFFRKWAVALRMLRATGKDLENEISAFRSYRAAGSQDMPLAKMPRTNGVPFHYLGAPELARLLNYITKHHPILIQAYFKGSPLNFPLGLAQILHTTHLESEGSIWVKNHQDIEREQPPKPGTPPPGANEKVLTGDEAEKVFAEAAARAEKQSKK